MDRRTHVSAAVPPACSVAALAVRLDSQPGRFTGMMHGGVEIAVRNVSDDPCTVAGRPELAFLDARRRPLPVGRGVPPHEHRGPVVPARTLAPGAVEAAHATWIVGDVFTNGICRKAAFVRVSTGAAATTLPYVATLCGPAGDVTYAAAYFTAAFEPLAAAASLPSPGAYAAEGPDGSEDRFGAAGAPRAILSFFARDASALRFTLDATNGPPAYDSGYISGTIPRAAKADFHVAAGPSAPCDLHFAFYGDRAVVTQRGTCGFGASVDATGRYVADPGVAPVDRDARAGKS